MQPRGKKAQGGGDAAAAQAAAAAAATRVRRDALLAVSEIEEAIWASRVLLPSIADMQAVSRLAQATALHCLAHPLPLPNGTAAERSAKALADSCQGAVTGRLLGWIQVFR
jgi:hypothetical protein